MNNSTTGATIVSANPKHCPATFLVTTLCVDAIALTQCYYAASQELCNKYPSSITMDDIRFLDFTGINSKKYDPRIGEIVCSSPEICTNFVAKNVNVTTSSGKPSQYTCVNFDKSQFDINCVTP